MKTLTGKALSVVVMTLCWFSVSKAEDSLGRLFFTPDQRAALEELRYQKPVVVKIPEIIFEEEPVVETEKPNIGNIEVNGLVYRSNGKSTAWVNRVNSYDGNLSNEYLQIDAGNIKPDDVEIVMPINDTKINLKAGESFDPEAGEVKKFSYQSR
jgi:hypothetical protein